MPLINPHNNQPFTSEAFIFEPQDDITSSEVAEILSLLLQAHGFALRNLDPVSESTQRHFTQATLQERPSKQRPN